MSTVVTEMGMSLDGFIAGPGDDLDRVLDSWLMPQSGISDTNRAIVEKWFTTAAAVMGRRMFDLGVERNGWNKWVENPPYQVPTFVPSHSVPDKLAADDKYFTFVTDGVVSAVQQAEAAAGDGTVTIIGGANVVQQALNAGLIDELHLHVVPIVLGAGIRLFENVAGPVELEVGRIVETPDVTHLNYRVRNNRS